jgi:hypothetical protein
VCTSEEVIIVTQFVVAWAHIGSFDLLAAVVGGHTVSDEIQIRHPLGENQNRSFWVGMDFGLLNDLGCRLNHVGMSQPGTLHCGTHFGGFGLLGTYQKRPAGLRPRRAYIGADAVA